MKTIMLFLFSVLFISVLSLQQKKKDEPITLNVTLEYPMNSFEEEKRYNEEFLRLKRDVRNAEEKIHSDMELFKMLVNIQNVQIQKVNEILNVNSAILKQAIDKDEK
jgi:hypothetical protein